MPLCPAWISFYFIRKPLKKNQSAPRWDYLSCQGGSISCQAPVHFPNSLITSVLLPATFSQSFSGQGYSCSLISYYNNGDGYIYIYNFSLITRFGVFFYWKCSLKLTSHYNFQSNVRSQGSSGHISMLQAPTVPISNTYRHCWRS